MGLENTNLGEDIVVPEALENPDKIGNVSKPPAIKCMPSCHVQNNPSQISFVPFPQHDNFFYQELFCHAATHVWQVSCQNEHRKFFLDIKHPNLCSALESFDEYFGNSSSCLEWPTIFFEKNDKPDETLINELYTYGSKNLALIHIFIQRSLCDQD